MLQMGDKGLDRRQFIQSLGAAGTLAVLSVPFLTVPGCTRASDSIAADGPIEHSRKMRSWCMVIDLKKCDGCVGLETPPQCTQACVNGHLVPKGQQWIQVFEMDLPGGGSFFMPVPCQHCESAPCVNVCPVAATYHTQEGLVLIDHRRCIGCRMCMAACPYQRRFFNWDKPQLPPEAVFAEYSPLNPIPTVIGTVNKCVFAAHLLLEGRMPFCVMGCPQNALYMGDLNDDIASNGREVVTLSRFLDDNNGYRFKEELGTQPRVWYLPGHGEDSGRKPDDSRQLEPVVWSWYPEEE
jgi:molybdopterin-containing oxidoreductase family iron-sulfur binding subunit